MSLLTQRTELIRQTVRFLSAFVLGSYRIPSRPPATTDSCRCGKRPDFPAVPAPIVGRARLAQYLSRDFGSARTPRAWDPLSPQEEFSPCGGQEPADGEARGGTLTTGGKSFKAPSHRRSGSRSPAFVSSMIFRATASRSGSA